MIVRLSGSRCRQTLWRAMTGPLGGVLHDLQITGVERPYED